MRTYREAIKMAKSGKYEKIYLNRSLKTITGGKSKSKLRPDVAGKLKGSNKIDMVEVPHPNQTQLEMTNKINDMNKILGSDAGPNSFATLPVK